MKRGYKLKKRFWAGVLSMIMVASSLPSGVMVSSAEEERATEQITEISSEEEGKEQEESKEEKSETESTEEMQKEEIGETEKEDAEEVEENESVMEEETEEVSTELSVMQVDETINLLNEITEEEWKEEDLFLYYDFDLQNSFSTVINDASGHRNAGELKSNGGGSVEGNYSIDEVNIYGNDVKALKLTGGSEGSYLQLPENILDGYKAVTISMWVNLSTDQGYQRIWDFGNDTTTYMYLLSDGYNEGFKGYAAAVTNGGWSNEKGVEKGSNIDKNRWVLTTLVYDENVMTLYENGEKIGSSNTDISIKDIWKTSNNYIGKGQFSDDPTNGQFAEIKIYGKALSDQEIADMYIVDDDSIAEADAKELKLENADAITESFDLITKGSNGSEISWKSNHVAIEISEDGKRAFVTRPAKGEEDVEVQLTATITYADKEINRTFDVKVLAEYTDAQIVAHDAAYVEEMLGDLDSITMNIELPEKGEWGSALSFVSENDAIVIEDGIAKVTRPQIGEENVTGKLIVTITYGEEEIIKELEVVVLAFKEDITIVTVEDINVVTRINHSPSLPNLVGVTFSDGTAAKLKVMWPEKIAKADYSVVGEFTVEGTIIGENKKVIANVEVVNESDIEKKVVSENFDLSDISLEGDSILTQNRDRDLVYLKLLDKDRMLYNFYMTFDVEEKIAGVEPLGGWDEPSGLLRGHSTGHYMSAMALAYASTGDEEFKDNLDYVVHELRQMQKTTGGNPADFVSEGTDQNKWSTDKSTWGEGFLSAYSPDQFALLEIYTPYAQIWAPYYTLHKLLAGLLDTYTYTGNEEALETAEALGGWVFNRLSACDQEQLTRMWDMYIAGEFGGFDESMAQLYIYTKNEDFLKCAKLFDNTTFFDNLANNEDDIAGRHANQHIPQIIGALKIYEATVQAGEPEIKYYDIAKNFWERTVSAYAFSTGGVGKGEKFTEPYTQANSIAGTTNAETCAAYNLLKLTKMLNNYDPDNAEYMDYYERTLYNQILASQTPNVTDNMHNGTTYMLPLGPGSVRSYGGDYDSFTCCHGTGMENHVKYQEAAYAKSGDTLYVSLYLPTIVEWKEKDLTIQQSTEFPSENATIEIKGKEGKKIDLKLRVPYWATNGFYVKVNGKQLVISPEVSSYVTVKDVEAGDIIDINMPYTLHLDKTPDKLGSSEVASVMYGPLVMAGQINDTDWKTLVLSKDLSDSIRVSKDESTDLPMLTTNGYKFYPMFAPIFATAAYDAYFKIITAQDDGSQWYEVSIINQTPKYGSVTIDSDFIKEGGAVKIVASPNENYKVNKLLINSKEFAFNEDNTYTIENVTEAITIEVTFGLINPPVADPAHLEFAASASSDYTADWENLDGIMTDWEPVQSNDGIGKGWGNWPQSSGSEHYVQYNWNEDVGINKLQVYWYDDEGDTAVPSSVKVMYMDASNTWNEVTIKEAQSELLNKNAYNTITFDTITTSSIKLVVTIAEGKSATGIYRLKVSGPEQKTEDPTEDPKDDEEEDNRQENNRQDNDDDDDGDDNDERSSSGSGENNNVQSNVQPAATVMETQDVPLAPAIGVIDEKKTEVSKPIAKVTAGNTVEEEPKEKAAVETEKIVEGEKNTVETEKVAENEVSMEQEDTNVIEEEETPTSSGQIAEKSYAVYLIVFVMGVMAIGGAVIIYRKKINKK